MGWEELGAALQPKDCTVQEPLGRGQVLGERVTVAELLK